MKNRFDKKELDNLYWGKNLSIRNIAIIYNCDSKTIRYWMNKYGISRREAGIAWLGKPRSEDTKRKISLAVKGRKHSETTRKKMSESQKGNKNHFYGKHHSEESRKKISKNNYWKGKKGKLHSKWKGGFVKYGGNPQRFYILMPSHPCSNRAGYIPFSHLIAEKALDRYLKKEELVHHRNGDSFDDRNDNYLICNRSYHSWLHGQIRKQSKICDPFLMKE